MRRRGEVCAGHYPPPIRPRESLCGSILGQRRLLYSNWGSGDGVGGGGGWRYCARPSVEFGVGFAVNGSHHGEFEG